VPATMALIGKLLNVQPAAAMQAPETTALKKGKKRQ